VAAVSRRLRRGRLRRQYRPTVERFRRHRPVVDAAADHPALAVVVVVVAVVPFHDRRYPNRKYTWSVNTSCVYRCDRAIAHVNTCDIIL
jgi:hypothetical protein